MAAHFQYSAYFIDRRTLHGGYISMRDRTCNGHSGSTVYFIWENRAVDSDTDRRSGNHCLRNSILYYHEKTYFTEREGRDPGSLQHGILIRNGCHDPKNLKGTICLEGIGALLYSFRFVPEFGVVKGIGYSVFHAVSAFCNAGIDILGDSSFIPYADSVVVNFTTILLVVLSGLGFTVWQDLGQNLKKVWKKELELRRLFKKLRLHSKIVLIMTSVLIVSGTLAFLLLEYNNPGTIGDMSFGEKLMSSLFHSVSTRTAGFATVPQGELTQGTMFTTCILMFIGGSPGGTAGGVKTTTIAMLILCCVSVLQNKKDVECFGRRIQADNIRTGICVVILAFVSLLAGTTLLTIFEGDVDFIRIMYETTSAIGTVGLSADLTSQLCTASKFVIMVLMYIGRLGPITFALAFGTGRKSKNHIRQLPVQGILIG